MRKKRFDSKEKKSVVQRVINGAVVLYAGFAICVVASIAETFTIPLARRRAKRRGRANEGL